MDSIYHEFALLLLMVSAVIGAIAVRLRQPLLLVAYIVVGPRTAKRSARGCPASAISCCCSSSSTSVPSSTFPPLATKSAPPSCCQVEVIHPVNQAADFAALDLAARIASAELSAAKESP
ncbi:MAG: hypothetical protein Q8S73_38445 [Deltaproteobacteria bacterium]|nr:hypothetical protein [Deltaproteobacteria bacterium]